ncbi:MAG: tripartite tricarboxylate transporter substrate binding protein [Proteobacteria bacterium]|jgi:tripartite-type tricarboxylate transporter receptor subunit TctC|nr:tripartite tricarboxylate transporter substrate binding protein [Pseudomonadota bacterium]
MSIQRSVIQALACAVLAVGGLSSAWAQTDYPNKPVKILVPFPPGGTSDVMARMVAEPLGRALGQPVVIENVGGAGGVVGTERGAKAAPDGYTIIQTGVGQSAVAHGLDANLKYDSKTDFIHLTQVHSGPNVLVVNTQRPFKNVKELVTFAKANPGKLDYGYVHAASGHMAMELFKQTAGIFMTGIPYRGGGPMLNAIIGNEIPVMFINQDVALPHIKSGKLRPLAVSSLERNALYPDVPTLNESGYPGFEALSWSGLSVPKGTPAPVVAKLEAALREVMASSAIKQRMDSQGFVVPPQGAKHYTEFVGKELDRWTKVIKTAGLKAQ